MTDLENGIENINGDTFSIISAGLNWLRSMDKTPAGIEVSKVKDQCGFLCIEYRFDDEPSLVAQVSIVAAVSDYNEARKNFLDNLAQAYERGTR